MVFEDQAVANIGFIVGKRCVAVIDSGGSYQEGQALNCAIRQVSALPVCFVINSHGHPDHILGNLVFKALGATFIGHANLPRAMALLGDIYLQRASQQAGRPVTSGTYRAAGSNR